MKITIAPYDPDWVNQFEQLKAELEQILQGMDPVIEHFGSTSIPGLAAKPVIDILVGLSSEAYFDEIVERMQSHPYIYYEVFNETMPNRRLFVRVKNDEDMRHFPRVFSQLEGIPHETVNEYRWSHVHIWQYGTPDWTRHLAFRDYVRAHPDVKAQYQALKTELGTREWMDGNHYNSGKDAFIKEVQARALKWYR